MYLVKLIENVIFRDKNLKLLMLCVLEVIFTETKEITIDWGAKKSKWGGGEKEWKEVGK